MSKSLKKWTSRLIKLAVCAGALWYLANKVTLEDYVRLADSPDKKHRLLEEPRPDTYRIQDIDTGEQRTVTAGDLAAQDQLEKHQRSIERGIKTVVKAADRGWGTWALLFFGPVAFILAWRLKCLLATQAIPISYRDALLLTFAGNFFNFAMPGTTGGDLYKAYHIAKRTAKRTEGVTIVVLDRVVGLISFLLIAAVAIPIAAQGTTIVGAYGRWVGYLTIALIACGLLYFSGRARQLIRYETWLAKLPFADKLKRIDETAFSFRHETGKAFIALIVTLISHFFVIGTIYLLARSLGIHPHEGHDGTELVLAILIAAVVGYLFAAIPISVQGFGLLEAVYYKVLVDGGWCDASTMLVLTLGTRLIQILWSMPGIIVPWLGMERPPQSEPRP